MAEISLKIPNEVECPEPVEGQYQPNYKYIPPADKHFLTPFYDPFCRLIGINKKFRQKILSLAAIKTNNKVADIGCGTGVFLEVAAQKYPQTQFTGIDPDKAALTIAKNRLDKFKNVKLEKGFAESLSLKNSSIDICFSTLAVHHLPNDIKKKAIAEMYRVLKPGGQIIITDFGQSKSCWLRKLLFFENIEYLKGNLDGLVLEYIDEAGLKNRQIVNKKFPNIITVVAYKL